MKKKFWMAAGWLFLFVMWTLLVRTVDVATIGPSGSAVGFATLNGWFHRLTGVHMTLYTITDWLGLVPVGVCFAFAGVGLCQWIRRRRLAKVDRELLLLGGFYLVTIALYLLFESVVINYRPVLIDGYLEASYPSSTTLLVLCVMPSSWLLLRCRIEKRVYRYVVTLLLSLFTVFMVVGRLLSGVHWLTDIVGGVLLSSGLVMLYHGACDGNKCKIKG